MDEDGRRQAHGRELARHKHWVAGAIERGGRVRIERIPDIKRRTLHDFIRRAVKDEAEAIYTDDLRSYIGIGDEDTRHETVNHSAEEWVIGDVHTNSIEGVWSLFKRSIVGSFHKMSAWTAISKNWSGGQQPPQPPHLPRRAGPHSQHRPAPVPGVGLGGQWRSCDDPSHLAQSGIPFF